MYKTSVRWSALLHAGAFCALTLWGKPAAAVPLFDLTGDTLSDAALQAGTLPGGSGAAYFNPALLVDSAAGVQINFLVVSQQIAVGVDGRPGSRFDVPADVSLATRGEGAEFARFDNYPIPTDELQNGKEGDGVNTAVFKARPRQGAGTGHEVFTFETIGLVVKFLESRFALGVHLSIPNGDFTRMKAYFNDEREQYFSNSLHPELYGDRLLAPALAMAAGVRVWKGLSLGVGATLNLAASVVAPTYVVSTADLGSILIDLNGKVGVSLAPHFGVNFTALGDRLRLTATAHAPSSVDVETEFTFLLASGVEQASGVNFVLDYSPWQASLGAAYNIIHSPERTLTLAGTLKYANWNAYLDRHGDKPSSAYPWADTISPTLGMRYRQKLFSAFLDANYTPTPVPLQTGRTNYVDNDRISTSLGGDFGFLAWGVEVHIGLQLQAHHLLSRYQAKLPTPISPSGDNNTPLVVNDEVPDDAQSGGEPFEGAKGLQTNNPGWPGFRSEGWIVASTLYLKFAL